MKYGLRTFRICIYFRAMCRVNMTYCAFAPDDVSLLFSEEVLKSTPPKPILGAGAAGAAVEVANREPNVKPPPTPPRVV